MEGGVNGDPGVPVMARQQRQEQGSVTTQHLAMMGQLVLDLQMMRLYAQVFILLSIFSKIC